MAVVAWSRLRMLWGALDWQQGSDHPYTSAQTFHGGANAAGPNPNIGIRKCVISFDRSQKAPALDDLQVHWSFLNMTNGAPDDTWITSDYTTLELYIGQWLATITPYFGSTTRAHRYSWYRQGAGIVPPNPAERVLDITPVPGTSSTGYYQAQQVASTITVRTAVRQSWGRLYLPFESGLPSGNGHLPSATVTAVANGANTFVANCASSDFIVGVYSATKQAFLAAEHVEVDDILDVMRSRRPRSFVSRVVLP